MGARGRPGRRRSARGSLPVGDQPGDVCAVPRLQDRAGAHRLHPSHAAAATVTSLFHLPAGYNEWRLALGATAHVGRAGVALLFVGAALAIALSMLALAEERRGRGLVLLGLRVLGVLACLVTALQPTIELRQVTRLPNRVAVLVDASRSMEVRPPDSGPSRAERASTMLERAAPRLAAWQRAGHEVDIYTFGENVSPATTSLLREAPAADATRIGEALGEI